MRFTYSLLFAFISFTLLAQVPKYGNDTLLDVACWNVEWFGNTSDGPTNEALQYTNVKSVLTNTDIDVWGLCEISDNTTWMNLLNDLTAYDGVIATYSQTQKTALLFKKSMFDLLSWQMVLNQSQYSYDFASRPPLEVVLVTKGVPDIDTFYFYIIHLKAFGDQESYNRRKNASGHLKTFLDASRRSQKVMVIGDWNDDVIRSTWTGTTESPFLNFVNDSINYSFISKRLSEMGKKSYASTNGIMIDHIMMNKQNFPYYVSNSSRVLDSLPFYISGFSNNTSDHYPVMGYFNYKRYPLHPPVGISDVLSKGTEIFVYPQPANDWLSVHTPARITNVEIVTMQGVSVFSGELINERIDVSALTNGLYLLKLSSENGLQSIHRIIIQR
jgi:hypothetical protein